MHVGEPKTDELSFSPTGLMGSPIAIDIKITDSGFFNANPTRTLVPFLYHFNVSVTMECQQSQVQAIMTNLSHLGTNITLNF
ncbi:hypothetical protein CTA2_754 [Colletotrichum tanaceti]|nr:hypothetical protein CTA2_754 [Colletotrichum tanaceti]